MSLLKDIDGIGPKSIEKLAALDIYTVEDLAFFTPARYIDLEKVSDLATAVRGNYVLLNIVVFDAKPIVRRGKRNFFIAYCYADSTKIKLVWYNQPYVAKLFKRDGRFVVYGKLDYDGMLATITNAKFEAIDEVKHLKGISPIYRTRGYFSQNIFSKMAQSAVLLCDKTNRLGEAIEKRYSLPQLEEALIKAHSPDSIKEGLLASRRINFELAYMAMQSYKTERAAVRRKKSRGYNKDVNCLAEAVSHLGFNLTADQRSAVEKIVRILRSDEALNALLLGDVGCGKTVVAVLLAYYAAKCGHQTAVLSPTGILTAQHYRTFSQILCPMGIRVACVVGDNKIADSVEATATADVLIGTHALLSSRLKWRSLGLLVVDEQHRFGIKQREQLLARAKEVDYLSLSATPIPRSLGLAMFGATQVYRISNRVDRSAVKTRVVRRDKQSEMLDFIIRRAACGEKAFVVAPAICDVEGLELSGVDGVLQDLSKRGGATVDFIHGKLKPSEKEEKLSAFADGRTKVLVATTVVEVGIDISGLSILAVMHAERFGLATLHQLRGRIGRQGQQSWCFLYTESDGDSLARLSYLEGETDGEKIAEYDYCIRGGGELLGLNQSGVDKLLGKLSLSDIKLLGEISEISLH